MKNTKILEMIHAGKIVIADEYEKKSIDFL